MKHFLPILIIAQLVCGFGFFRPRHVHSGRITQMSGLTESVWVNSAGAVGLFEYADESNKTKVRTSGQSQYARVWVRATSGTWTLAHIRGLATNSFAFITETTFVPATTGTNQVPAVFTLEEGDLTSMTLPNGTASISFTSSGAGVAGITSRGTNAHQGSGTWIYAVTTGTGLALNYGLYGYGPALGVVGDSNPSGFPGYFPFLVGQNIGGVGTNVWTHMLRNRHGYRAHMKNYAVGGQTAFFVNNTEMPVVQVDVPKVLLYQCNGNDIVLGTNSSASLAQTLEARRKHPGPFYMMSIFPGNAYTDAEHLARRQMNTNLFLLARSNGAFFFDWDPIVGTNRTSTGQLDDLKPEYNFDGAHLTWIGKRDVTVLLANMLTLHLK